MRKLETRVTGSDFLILVLLAAIWGASFLFLRIASPVFGPMFLIEMRVLSAFVVMFPVFLIIGNKNDLLKNWKTIFMISLANMAIPFCLLAFAALSIGAGVISIINASVPFFTAIIAFFAFRQALGFTAILGLVIGFSGVVLLVLDPGSNTPLADNLLAFSAGILASVFYGVGANMSSHYFDGVSGFSITLGSLFFSSLYLAPFAWLQRPEVMPSGVIWFSVIALGCVCTGLAYVLFYKLISNIGSARAVTVAFLIPPFSILWAWLFLGEPLTLSMALGCALVLLGVGLTTGMLPNLVRRRPGP